ncbi:antibiotic biosynthesis monooxygenase family protein [Thalassotalea atypica]|uniref:antibiotic biosynthesis monooxygenase family protein n=1 Tax=Thalassotalea atypica TaxID=2054316 RepID=UPI002574536A|nr:antibiotic biosynthesis monooxygenase [Thalassotalea atypica]
MFAVIFRATTKNLDVEYDNLVQELREIAFSKYRCIEFVAVSEGEDEIAISYWHSLEDIKQWKQDTRHLFAQKMGQEKWYSQYRIQVVEVQRDYQFDTDKV